MKYLKKLATALCSATVAVAMLSSCEGSELFNVNAPSWLQDRIDSLASNENSAPIIAPLVLGATDNSDAFWGSHLENDIKIESKKSYTTTFTNYTNGLNNWNNYYVVLRKRDLTEYVVLRADDYGWSPEGKVNAYAASKHDNTGSTDWVEWRNQMNGAKVTLTVTNYGDKTCDVVAKVVGNQGLETTQTYLGIPIDEPGNLYLDITTEGSHYVFDKAEMDVADVIEQQPVSMELSNVPDEVLLGSKMKDFTSKIKATVTYSEGGIKEINASDLEFTIVPDLETVGEKYVVATLNKSFLNKVAEKPITANAKFNVVTEYSAYTQKYFCPANPVLGATDNTSGFHADRTESVKIEPRQTLISTFTNYSDCAANWNNFLIFLTKGGGEEYCFVRADNWGTGTGYAGVIPETDMNWDLMPGVMDGAKVTTFITNNNDGTCDVKAIMVGNNNETYTQTYNGIKVDKNDLYCHFSTERSHLVFTSTIGATDNTSGFGVERGPKIQIPSHTVSTVSFINYSDCAANWNNFLVFLNKNDGTEYCFVRADNWGTGTGYAGVIPETNMDWSLMPGVMNGAKVDLSISNNGDGTCDIVALMTGNNGVTYTQKYNGIKVDKDDLYYTLSVERAHLVLNSPTTQARAKKASR